MRFRCRTNCKKPFAWCRIPFGITRRYIAEAEEPYSAGEERATSRFFEGYLYITFFTGSALTLYFMASAIVIVFFGKRTEGRNYLMVPSNTRGESRLKEAATRKLNTMLQNAHGLHDLDGKSCSSSGSQRLSSKSGPSNPTVDRTMLNYVLNGQRIETVGGLRWTWSLVLSGELFDTEGIWLPTRLVVFQGAQILICSVLALIYYVTIEIIADYADEAQDTLPDDLPQWAREYVCVSRTADATPSCCLTEILLSLISVSFLPGSKFTLRSTPLLLLQPSRWFSRFLSTFLGEHCNQQLMQASFSASLSSDHVCSLFDCLVPPQLSSSTVVDRLLPWGAHTFESIEMQWIP